MYTINIIYIFIHCIKISKHKLYISHSLNLKGKRQTNAIKKSIDIKLYNSTTFNTVKPSHFEKGIVVYLFY